MSEDEDDFILSQWIMQKNMKKQEKNREKQEKKREKQEKKRGKKRYREDYDDLEVMFLSSFDYDEGLGDDVISVMLTMEPEEALIDALKREHYVKLPYLLSKVKGRLERLYLTHLNGKDIDIEKQLDLLRRGQNDWWWDKIAYEVSKYWDPEWIFEGYGKYLGFWKALFRHPKIEYWDKIPMLLEFEEKAPVLQMFQDPTSIVRLVYTEEPKDIGKLLSMIYKVGGENLLRQNIVSLIKEGRNAIRFSDKLEIPIWATHTNNSDVTLILLDTIMQEEQLDTYQLFSLLGHDSFVVWDDEAKVMLNDQLFVEYLALILGFPNPSKLTLEDIQSYLNYERNDTEKAERKLNEYYQAQRLANRRIKELGERVGKLSFREGKMIFPRALWNKVMLGEAFRDLCVLDLSNETLLERYLTLEKVLTSRQIYFPKLLLWKFLSQRSIIDRVNTLCSMLAFFSREGLFTKDLWEKYIKHDKSAIHYEKLYKQIYTPPYKKISSK